MQHNFPCLELDINMRETAEAFLSIREDDRFEKDTEEDDRGSELVGSCLTGSDWVKSWLGMMKRPELGFLRPCRLMHVGSKLVGSHLTRSHRITFGQIGRSWLAKMKRSELGFFGTCRLIGSRHDCRSAEGSKEGIDGGDCRCDCRREEGIDGWRDCRSAAGWDNVANGKEGCSLGGAVGRRGKLVGPTSCKWGEAMRTALGQLERGGEWREKRRRGPAKVLGNLGPAHTILRDEIAVYSCRLGIIYTQ